MLASMANLVTGAGKGMRSAANTPTLPAYLDAEVVLGAASYSTANYHLAGTDKPGYLARHAYNVLQY